MAREEARSRVIEDGTTGQNLIINSDGTLNSRVKDASGNDIVVDTDSRLRTGTRSFIDTGNSTTTPLGAGETFTGEAKEILDTSVITIFLHADQNSATDGFTIEWSTDGTNWDDADVFSYTTTGSKQYSLGPMATRYYRVVYTNGSTAQTVFRLQAILHSFYIKPSTHRVKDTISDENDAELVISTLKGQSVLTDAFETIKTRSNRLLVSQEPISPAGATPVEEVEFGSVGSTAGVDNLHTIANGKTLTIQRFTAGSEAETGGAIVELFEDPNGDKSVLNRIDQIFVDGGTTELDINKEFVGDGTRRIVMRRRTYSGASREMSGKWVGFEE